MKNKYSIFINSYIFVLFGHNYIGKLIKPVISPAMGWILFVIICTQNLHIYLGILPSIAGSSGKNWLIKDADLKYLRSFTTVLKYPIANQTFCKEDFNTRRNLQTTIIFTDNNVNNRTIELQW